MNKKVAYGGVGTAIAVILLAMATYLPTGKAATLFLASLTVYIMCLFACKKTAAVVYVASSVLSLLMASAGAVGIIAAYVICFGNYPIFKCLADRLSLVLKVILKLMLYTIYCVLVYGAFKLVIGISLPYPVLAMYICGIFVFAFYDYLLNNTGMYAMNILSKRFK